MQELARDISCERLGHVFQAWHPDKVSVWCSAFEDEDLMVLEYHEELKYWSVLGTSTFNMAVLLKAFR